MTFYLNLASVSMVALKSPLVRGGAQRRGGFVADTRREAYGFCSSQGI
jgi:hypothetical protein